ncbi:phage baseplate plug family protein [Brevibacillus laterosporus]|uniref:Cyanophage baseplate Pam3 plug gp18 domain-containing protein n=1 Tax=Brevibacillus laterosporus TaxID=1465 RepID=A0A0F7EET2_BRELA|nr:hypothetical protein EX87_02830 [Brevibacillus laterosporus]
MEYIPIEKELIPYKMEIELGVELFEIEINYNDRFHFFTLDLIKNNELLVMGAKLVYGVPVFEAFEDNRFPAPLLLPIDPAGREKHITWDNFGETVLLQVGEDD